MLVLVRVNARRRFLLFVGAVFLMAGACRQNKKLPDIRPAPKPQESPRSALQKAEWQRHDPRGKVAVAVKSPNSSLRSQAILAAGRAALDLPPQSVIRLINDPKAQVRRQAAFALSLGRGSRATDSASRKSAAWASRIITTRLRREKDATVKAALIRALGWLGSKTEIALLLEQLKGPVAASAMTALGIYQSRGGDLSAYLTGFHESLSSKNGELAFAAAWVLSQSQGSVAPELVEALRRLGKEGPLNLRRYCLRALARKNAQLHRAYFLNRLDDASPLVQIEAVRALGRGRVRGAVNLSQRLRLIWRRVAASHQRLTGVPLKVLTEGLVALHPFAKVPTIQIFAKDLMELSDTTGSTVKYSPSQAHSIDLVNCLSAQLLDLGVGRPENTATCGHAKANALSSAWRRRLVVETISKTERDARWKLILLRRYLSDPLVAVRKRAVEALGDLKSPEIVAPLTRALKDPDVGVFQRALYVVEKRSDILNANTELASLILKRDATASGSALPELGCRLSRAFQALNHRAATPLLSGFARSGNRGLQECAWDALVALGVSRKVAKRDLGDRIPLPMPDLSWFNNRDVPRKLMLVTDRGEIEIELYPHLARATIARVVELAEQRAYRGSVVSSVVVGSSILFSEVKRPAKPLLPVPSEPSDVSFERGSVGFYQKRLDGGRSQFFISLEAQPSLRGRMTLLGKVVKGLNLVESFLVGDRIKDFYPPK
jgi:peptidyl-prolyl cis-trans isomerase B (cyclophilin B)